VAKVFIFVQNETTNDNHPSGFWHSRRVCVMRQHGAGFLGSFVVHKLRQHGAKDVFVPRRADHDLVQADAIRRLLSDACPDVVIHLAARVVSIEVTAADTPSGHRPPRAYPVQGTSQGHRRGDEDGLARKGILA